MKECKHHFEPSFTGALLIGLALLFVTGWWWPGVLFVIAGAMIARTVSVGGDWRSEKRALFLLVMGVIFTLTKGIFAFTPSFFPLILIGIGVYLLFGNQIRERWHDAPPHQTPSKPKHDEGYI